MSKRKPLITKTIHPADGFTLQARKDNGDLVKFRYIGYGDREAQQLFRRLLDDRPSTRG